jgi:TonB family protein
MNKAQMLRTAPALVDSVDLAFDRWNLNRASDRNRLLWAALPAALVHMALLALRLPTAAPLAAAPEPQRPVMRLQEIHLRAPEPPDKPPVPVTHTSHPPIPVPTLDDVQKEPVRELPPIPTAEVPATGFTLELPVPSQPPAPEQVAPEPAASEGPVLVSGEITKPIKISGPEPGYTEMARQVHLRGTVIVQATIDKQGRVIDLKLLRGLPLGLSENTLAALRQWRFEPATLRGEPIAVLYNLTVRFELV